MAPTTKLLLLFTLIPLFLILFLPSSCFSSCLPTERHALLQFKAHLNYSSPSNLNKWEEDGDCCLWPGIPCHNTTHRVVSLDIEGEYNPYDPFTTDMAYGGVISDSFCTLTYLDSISLSYMGLTGPLPPCFGNLTSLIELDLSGNKLRGNIPSNICMLSNLRSIDLYGNELDGSLPSCLGNLSSLQELYIDENHITGKIPYSFGKMSSLEYFDVSGNSLSGNIPYSLGNLSLLKELLLRDNRLNGTIPSLSRLSSLAYFLADGNAFNSIASSPFPPLLPILYLSFDGQHVISEAFLDNLTELQGLYLSDCVLNISKTWIPSFLLKYLSIRLCNMDGHTPLWISTQSLLVQLEFVDNNLVGEIPSWLLDMNILSINLTTNQLQGKLLLNTSTANPLRALDVSRNALSGRIPSIWPPNITLLLLNDNLFTGNIPPDLQGISSLKIANFANNLLNGTIPPTLANCSELQVLHLEDNHLRGTIPDEITKLSKLQSLVLKKNELSGFPLSIANLTKLNFLDVGENGFIGHIPKSIGNISELKVLTMRKNYFDGSIPAEIGQLKNLQILDLSSNNLSGIVPSPIFSLQAMLVESHQDTFEIPIRIRIIDDRQYYVSYTYKNELAMDSKSRDENYTYIFPTLMAIELSNNQLSGNLPSALGKLKGLKLFNISMNNFTGALPDSIVQMIWLETLDISSNHISGQIPSDLASLNYLGALNFSNNELTGSIPQGHMATFTKASYSGNPNLWGCPLPKKCLWPEFSSTHPSISINEKEKSKVSVGYDIGVGLSHLLGFTIVLVLILLNKICLEGVDFVVKAFFPRFHNLTL